MKTIEIYITKDDIDKRIFATSAYTARAREAMGTPVSITERMLVTADDAALIHPLIDGSANEVITTIVRYHPNSNVEFSNMGYKFTIKAPENFPAENGGKLEQSIKSYIINSTLKSWYTDVKPDEAAITATKAQNDATTLHALLTQRIKPTKQEDLP